MFSRMSDFDQDFTWMDELRRRMERVWDEVDPSARGRGWNSRPLAASAWPRLNLYDAGSSLVLKADVPGLSEKDVQVTLNDGGISISGERKVAAPEGYSTHRQERGSVQFSRSLSLPCKVDAEQTSATVKNGVLTITLTKAPEAQPRQISVRTQ
jgi:HSP20 family protein